MNIKLLPTLKDKMYDNAAWCVAFDLAWKEFFYSVLKVDFNNLDSVYLGDKEVVKNLIKECLEDFVIDDNEYYVTSGKQTISLKKKIEKVLKDKFKTKSDVLDSIEFSKDENTMLVLVYAILMFEIKFRKKFKNFQEQFPFGKDGKMASFFGFKNSRSEELQEQVSPLFYNNDNDFALTIESEDNKSIILYRTDDKGRFESILNQLRQKSEIGEECEVKSMMVPALKLDLIEVFKDLDRQKFHARDNEIVTISTAMQSLKFALNNEGAKVKSEAVISCERMAYFPAETIKKRDFIFNNTFYLFIFEDNTPLVALRVEDISLFQ